MYSDFETISTYDDDLYVKNEEYSTEATRVKQLLAGHGARPSGRMLVLACCTGGHIPFFRDDYRIFGLDLSRDMLAKAEKNFPAGIQVCHGGCRIRGCGRI